MKAKFLVIEEDLPHVQDEAQTWKTVLTYVQGRLAKLTTLERARIGLKDNILLYSIGSQSSAPQQSSGPEQPQPLDNVVLAFAQWAKYVVLYVLHHTLVINFKGTRSFWVVLHDSSALDSTSSRYCLFLYSITGTIGVRVGIVFKFLKYTLIYYYRELPSLCCANITILFCDVGVYYGRCCPHLF